MSEKIGMIAVLVGAVGLIALVVSLIVLLATKKAKGKKGVKISGAVVVVCVVAMIVSVATMPSAKDIDRQIDEQNQQEQDKNTGKTNPDNDADRISEALKGCADNDTIITTVENDDGEFIVSYISGDDISRYSDARWCAVDVVGFIERAERYQSDALGKVSKIVFSFSKDGSSSYIASVNPADYAEDMSIAFTDSNDKTEITVTAEDRDAVKQEYAQSKYTEASSTSTNSEGKKSDNDEWVTYEEFEKIESGMALDEVREIIGSDGKLMSSSDIGMGEEYVTEIYYWYAKNGIANCNVTFQGGKVLSKAQFGLD